MHKYLHHIGDFMRDTVHLSTLEECFYRRALDFYYLNEKPLPKETHSVFRRLRATTEDEKNAVLNVLADFFTEEEDGFHNKRCDAEIVGYKANANKNRENGKKGGRPPKNQANANPEETHSVNLGSENESQNNLNHKPLTINQEPITSNQYKYTFDLNFVNVNLQKSGAKPVDQKYVDALQSDFEIYYADQHLADNKALIKFVQWIRRNQEREQTAKPAQQDKWNAYFNNTVQQTDEVDVTPKKSLLIEGVGHA